MTDEKLYGWHGHNVRILNEPRWIPGGWVVDVKAVGGYMDGHSWSVDPHQLKRLETEDGDLGEYTGGGMDPR